MLTTKEIYVLLAIQHRGDDAYGVTIQEEIEQRAKQTISFAGLYKILSRLEEGGLVTPRDGGSMPERGGRPKRLYNLTGAGLRALRNALAELDRMANRPVAVTA